MATKRATGGGGAVIGLVLGIALGAGLAMLFAPSSGRETRSKLRQRGREARERWPQALQGLRQRATSAVGRGKEARQRLGEQAETLQERARERGQEALQRARETAGRIPVAKTVQEGRHVVTAGVSSITSSAKASWEGFCGRFREAVAAGRERARQARDEARARYESAISRQRDRHGEGGSQ